MTLAQGITFIDDTNFDPRGKRVLLRLDLNVPLDKNGLISDDLRIRAALPTIKLLQKKGARIVVLSHLGRPKGNPDPKLSLKTVSLRLKELLGSEVHMATDCVGQFVKAETENLADGDVLLLENVRFHERETKNYKAFANDLMHNGDLFVNDAFGTCHRAHASVAGLAEILPSAAGLLIRKELEAFSGVLEAPRNPFAAVLGGAKVKDKIGVIDHLLNKVDLLVIGGGMAYTFLAAQGLQIGTSLYDPDHRDFAKHVLANAKSKAVEVLLPVDHVVGHGLNSDRFEDRDAIPATWGAYDIGPKTRALYSERLAKAKTIIFNGPMGVFEKEALSHGTRAVLQGIADAHSHGASVIVGGGDSAAAVAALGYEGRVTHISTGGGASLELLEGKVLPGVAALRR